MNSYQDTNNETERDKARSPNDGVAIVGGAGAGKYVPPVDEINKTITAARPALRRKQ